MDREIKVVLFGLGPMGILISKALLNKKSVKVVGAIDPAPDVCGKDLGEILGFERAYGLRVNADDEAVFSKTEADIAIIATRSRLEDVYPQIVSCIKAGVNVISTCEELSFPYHKHPKLSKEIDMLAKQFEVTVLGTGINPGFLMDTLPIILSVVCQRVECIRVTRMMNSSKRRVPYQKKMGIGLTVDEIRDKLQRGIITGHVGLIESVAMIANALGWKLDLIKELPPEPVLADKEVVTSYVKIEPGSVAGLRSVAQGIKDGKPIIVLEFVSHATVHKEFDSISIEGVPKIYEKISGGVHGDIGTAAVVVNMIPKVLNAAAGLVTMKDMPLPCASTEDFTEYVSFRRHSKHSRNTLHA